MTKKLSEWVIGLLFKQRHKGQQYWNALVETQNLMEAGFVRSQEGCVLDALLMLEDEVPGLFGDFRFTAGQVTSCTDCKQQLSRLEPQFYLELNLPADPKSKVTLQELLQQQHSHSERVEMRCDACGCTTKDKRLQFGALAPSVLCIYLACAKWRYDVPPKRSRTRKKQQQQHPLASWAQVDCPAAGLTIPWWSQQRYALVGGVLFGPARHYRCFQICCRATTAAADKQQKMAILRDDAHPPEEIPLPAFLTAHRPFVDILYYRRLQA